MKEIGVAVIWRVLTFICIGVGNKYITLFSGKNLFETMTYFLLCHSISVPKVGLIFVSF